MKDIQNLLTHVSIITKKNNELLDATGGNFNIFRVLGLEHYENKHSTIICEFLNPKGSHGLKELFLKAFLDIHIEKNQLGFEEFACRFDYKNAKAYPEYPTHDGRIDILVEDIKGHAIVIENKIYAGDQREQLRRYNKFALHKYLEKENYKILYLTLNGKEASADSGDGVSYIQISYSENIIEWLEKCVSLAARHPLVRETIIQYINHLKKITNQDMSTNNTTEIVKLITSREENIDASIVLNRNYNALCKAIIDEIVLQVLKPQMEEFATENGLILYRINCSVNEFNIEFEKSSWTKCRMLINMEGAGTLYGFRYNNSEIKIEKSIIDSIKKNLPKANTSDWWPIFKKIDDYKYIDIDVWRNEIKSKAFGKYVIKLFSELLKYTKHLEL
jgi:hypothetical protein